MAVQGEMNARICEGLYVEVLILADEVRCHFDEKARDERAALEPLLRVGYSCEALKVTTRLMNTIAWLLTNKAYRKGELGEDEIRAPSRRLGRAPVFDEKLRALMPPQTASLIARSEDVYRRVALLDASLDVQQRPPLAAILSRIQAAR